MAEKAMTNQPGCWVTIWPARPPTAHRGIVPTNSRKLLDGAALPMRWTHAFLKYESAQGIVTSPFRWGEGRGLMTPSQLR